jgi:mannose-6-phosphate isomerase-like protein (cupin superfamily)
MLNTETGQESQTTHTSTDKAAPTPIQPYRAVKPYKTKDGSTIRELMHPAVQGNLAQSLAEAIIPVGTRTILHQHHKTEELYHVTAGRGLMTLGDACFAVKVGDTVLIPPGVPHRIEAAGFKALHILCCCSPAYSHDDTELLEDERSTDNVIEEASDSQPKGEKLSKPTQKKQPKLFISKGEDAKALRKKLGLNQADFWGRIMVTQSGGSRYESGRDMPEPVAMLVHLTYGSEKQALALLEHLRGQIGKSASSQ